MFKENEYIDDKEIEEKFLAQYRKTLTYLACDVPLEALCLPKTIQEKLFANGFHRVYDLIGADLTKIKGFGPSRINFITSSLNEFLSMGF